MPKNRYGRHLTSMKYFYMKTNIKHLQYININWEKTKFGKEKFPKSSLITNNLVEHLIAY